MKVYKKDYSMAMPEVKLVPFVSNILQKLTWFIETFDLIRGLVVRTAFAITFIEITSCITATHYPSFRRFRLSRWFILCTSVCFLFVE